MVFKHKKQLDVRFIGEFTESQLNDWVSWFWEQGIIVNKLLVSEEQYQYICRLVPIEVKGTLVYETDYQTILIKVKK